MAVPRADISSHLRHDIKGDNAAMQGGASGINYTRSLRFVCLTDTHIMNFIRHALTIYG